MCSALDTGSPREKDYLLVESGEEAGCALLRTLPWALLCICVSDHSADLYRHAGCLSWMCVFSVGLEAEYRPAQQLGLEKWCGTEYR